MRAHHRKQLNKLLESADDEAFVQLLWATGALQSGNSQVARKLFDPNTVSKAYFEGEVSRKYRIYEWELETLFGELMTVPKRNKPKKGKLRSLNTANFDNIVNCVNRLRKLENSEYRIRQNASDILSEMRRICNRQLNWQRGFFNPPQLYRNIYIYGQGESAAYFERKYGVSISRFTQIGYAIFAVLYGSPDMNKDCDMSLFDITQDELDQVLAMISTPVNVARRMSKASRKSGAYTAYKPSILRSTPCISFGKSNERIRSPLPQLIIERITSGLFYDIVRGGGPVRNDYGRRFEVYSLKFLEAMLPKLEWAPEFKYRVKPNEFDSPDILCGEQNALNLVIECKSTRMSHKAMFGRNPSGERGVGDLIKGVFQIWRFVSHCRRGIAERKCSGNVVGMVLTLDNWLEMETPLRVHILEKATEIAARKDKLIAEVDRIPIVFSTIMDLEHTARLASEVRFFETIASSLSAEFQGWNLEGVFQETNGGVEGVDKEYPFLNSLGSLIPWWDEIPHS